MNDLYYIEYRPELMLSDSMDMDSETELAHRRLCDFIWRMDKAPKADNEFLKQFTKTRASDWGRVKRGLLDKGWAEVDGLFLHKGAIETLNAAKVKYADACNQTAPATAKRTGSELKWMICETDPVTGIVALKVTSHVAPVVTSVVTNRQSEQELESELKKKISPPLKSIPKDRGIGERSGDATGGDQPRSSADQDQPDHIAHGAREIPDEPMAVAIAERAGVLPEFAKYVFRQWQMRAGKDASGVLVDWGKYVKGRWENECVEWRNGTHRGNRQGAGARAGERKEIKEGLKLKTI